MYAGVVLGGLGSIVGAFWGGMIIGLVQQLSTLVLPIQLQNTAIFVVFLLIVFLRPQGLFGTNVHEGLRCRKSIGRRPSPSNAPNQMGVADAAVGDPGRRLSAARRQYQATSTTS